MQQHQRHVTPLDGERLRRAVDALAAKDRDVRRALDRIGYPEARTRAPGFGTLVRIVAAQQVSTASAEAVWRKLELLLGGDVMPERYLGLGDAELRATGLSARKVAYTRGLAAAVVAGDLDIPGLVNLDEEEAIARVTRLKGFGRWSAEIYLLFALGREDVFPADDLAVQVGFRRLKGLAARPTAKVLRVLAEPWRPLRGVGAVFLWEYYLAGMPSLDDAA